MLRISRQGRTIVRIAGISSSGNRGGSVDQAECSLLHVSRQLTVLDVAGNIASAKLVTPGG